MKAEAKMYYFLSEGEKRLGSTQPQTHEALTQFLRAKQENPRSPLPHMKIGDMFYRLHDYQNALINYKLAADRAPNNIEVWSKYMAILVENFEWAEAQKAMEKFRKLPVPQSAVDKAAADMYAKQGRHREAQTYYVRAMSRDSIDPGVYIAYAKSLMNSKNYREAPFFFALALRFDPLNTDALIGTARCVAATESIDRAISMLQDEMQKGSRAVGAFLSAIAEFQIQKGDWDLAQQNVNQAMAADPDLAEPWRLQAEIYLNQGGQSGQSGKDREVLNKALAAYQSYSDRNVSDPIGHLERYKLFIKKTDFEAAANELEKIYSIYPKYPNLHYYKGALFSIMRNRRAAIAEFKAELDNNPNNMTTLKALGKEYVEQGTPDQGLPYFTKAMTLEPEDAEAKAEAANANFLMKNFTGAAALYQAALVYDPANPALYKRMGIAFRAAGDHNSATQAFRKYLELEPDAPDKMEFQRYR
jgi:tetratricopeptide (TPR) repeat protein